MPLLENKVAVITGSSRGLGLAIARAYVREGAAVVLSSRSLDAVERAAAELRSQGLRAAACACDVAYSLQVEALAEFARRPFDGWMFGLITRLSPALTAQPSTSTPLSLCARHRAISWARMPARWPPCAVSWRRVRAS